MTSKGKQPSQNQKIPQVQGNTPSFCELEEQACSAWLADVEVPGEHEPVASQLQAWRAASPEEGPEAGHTEAVSSSL